jgi:hypothetical protein
VSNIKFICIPIITIGWIQEFWKGGVFYHLSLFLRGKVFHHTTNALLFTLFYQNVLMKGSSNPWKPPPQPFASTPDAMYWIYAKNASLSGLTNNDDIFILRAFSGWHFVCRLSAPYYPNDKVEFSDDLSSHSTPSSTHSLGPARTTKKFKSVK